MNYTCLKHSVCRSLEYRGSTMKQRAIWIDLLFYCCDQENYGRIVKFTDLKPRTVYRTFGVQKRIILQAETALWHIEDDGTLVVFGYPTETQDKLQKKRQQLRVNCNREEMERAQADPLSTKGEVVFAEGLGKDEDLANVVNAEIVYADDDAAVSDGDLVEHKTAAVVETPSATAVEPKAGKKMSMQEAMDVVEQRIGKAPSMFADLPGFNAWKEKRDAILEEMGFGDQQQQTSHASAAVAPGAPSGDAFDRFAGQGIRGVALCVNELRPGWRMVNEYTAREARALSLALPVLDRLTPSQWRFLQRYYDRYSGTSTRGKWTPETRFQFLSHAGDVLQQAFNGKR